jgi:hypothetical protein
MALWKELIREIAPDVTAILATATDEQIDELFENLERQNQKFKEKYIDLPPEELIQNRQKRTVKHIKYWISRLNPDQTRAVAEWNSRLAPIAVEWLQNRVAVQAEARSLLMRRNDDSEFQAAMQDLIINPEKRRSIEYQRRIDINTDVSIKFVVKLVHLLTEDQRSHLQDRIESLAADLDALSCDPQEVPNPAGI